MNPPPKKPLTLADKMRGRVVNPTAWNAGLGGAKAIDDDAFLLSNNAQVILTRELAVRVDLGLHKLGDNVGREVWLPKSVLHKDNEATETVRGRCIVALWFACEQGWAVRPDKFYRVPDYLK
jgi:hypothetical protein